MDASLALVAFGAVQLFDFAADVVLVVHFSAGAEAEHLERVVLRVVTWGLLLLGWVTGVVSVAHLRNGAGPTDSTASVILASASLVALTALALRKRYIAVRLPSQALLADGNLTGVGATLAAVTVVGVSAADLSDWWWMDPAAALVISAGAIAMGVTTSRRSRIPELRKRTTERSR
jgi:divalent metal cation (Fe/Co/Zn/Cd) transporter